MNTRVGIISESGVGDFFMKSYALKSIEDKFGEVDWIFYIRDYDNMVPGRSNIIIDFVKNIDWGQRDVRVKIYPSSMTQDKILTTARDECDFAYYPWTGDLIADPKFIYPEFYHRFKCEDYVSKYTICPEKQYFVLQFHSHSRQVANRNLSFFDRQEILNILSNSEYQSIIFSWNDPDFDKYHFDTSKITILKNPSTEEVVHLARLLPSETKFVGVNSWVSTVCVDRFESIIWSEPGPMKGMALKYYQTLACGKPIKVFSTDNNKKILEEIASVCGKADYAYPDRKFDSDYYNEGYFLQCINSNYGEWNKPDRELYVVLRDYMMDCLPIHPGDRALELGCGNAGLMLRFLEKEVTVDGLDLSKWAKENAPEEVANRFFVDDIMSPIWPVDSEVYDFVYSNQVFEHLRAEEVPGVLEHAASLVKPNGFLYIQTPVKGLGHNDEISKIDASHRTFFTMEEWEEIGSKIGLVLDRSLMGRLFNHKTYSAIKCDALVFYISS